MHIANALVRLGHSVGVLDLDLRQRSFGRYIDNRIKFMNAEGLDLPCPVYRELPTISPDSLGPGENMYDQRLSAAVTGLEDEVEFILIDCPGSHTRLSQVAHSLADTLQELLGPFEDKSQAQYYKSRISAARVAP